MQLRDLTRDIYLFAATFRDRMESGRIPPVTALAGEVKNLFAAMDQKARLDPALSARYDQLRYALVGLVDEIIVSSTWSEAPQWPTLEFEFYGAKIAGDRVYELIEALTPADHDLIEGYFYILALGFRGKHAFDESQWAAVLQRLYGQLPYKMEEVGFKLTPEAYEVIEKKSSKLDPLFSLGKSLVIFLICLVLIIVFYQVAWVSSVNDARDKAEEVRINLNDSELRENLKGDAQ